ncbi:alpha/beta fold hydrolase [Nocardia caishijiensis]|uniref:alpha/beta fold hydrolase n=1 Tax=Nocardia caishijiensis TaxID=184756 RepID=UPI00133117B8|nr:alpha/beta hydrolase [Nocardia caishijiensis]
MEFVDEGAGPVIVCVHGIPGSVDWFGAVAERLTSRFRVIRLDLRDPVEDFAAPARTAPLAALFEELDLSDVTVVGHSFGAEIALELATLPRVARAVVIGQSPDYTVARIPGFARWVVRPWSVRLAQRWTPGFVIRLGNRTLFAPRFRYASVPGLSEAVVRDFRSAAPAGLAYAVGERAAEFAARPLDARVAALDVPVLAVHGRHDHLYDATATLDRYAAAGARTHLVEHAGHSPQVEQPDEFVTVLAEFVRSEPVER